MATANDYFPSNYIRAADLGGKPRTVTIDRVAEDLFENDGRKQKKAIAHFRENGVKPLVLNKTNFLTIATLCGDDTAEWPGKQIVIYPDMVAFRGKVSEAVRVRVTPKTAASTQSLPAAAPKPDFDDTIPW
jgi:hypothetical protein